MPMDEMDYEIRNKQIEQVLRRLGHEIKDLCPAGWGFMLMLFNFGEGGKV